MDKIDGKPALIRQRVKLFLLLLIAGSGISMAGCSLYLKQKAQALTPAQKSILVIGHAGLGFLSPLNPFNPYPANSITSLTRALDAGVDGLEVDIHLSQDGVPILFHDPQLESMTSARGLIEEKPAEVVIGLPYRGGLIYDLFHQEKVASFEELLQQIQAYPQKPYLHLDLRQEGQERSVYYARALLKLLDQYQYPVDKLTVISEQVQLLQAFRQQEPRITCLLDSQGDFEAVLDAVLKNDFPGLVINAADMTPQRMRRVRQHRLQVVLFGPKAPQSIYKAVLLGPDALQVNNVTALVRMVKKR